MKRTRLRSRSPDSVRGSDERAEVVADVFARDRGCVLAGFSPCRGPHDPHELVRAGQMPSALLDRELVVRICRGHHDLDDSNPRLAERLGIRIGPEAFKVYGRARCLEFAAEGRRLARLGETGPAPFWR